MICLFNIDFINYEYKCHVEIENFLQIVKPRKIKIKALSKLLVC